MERPDDEALPETREPYVAPEIEEALDFETTALASCSKEPTSGACRANPPTATS
jgi:hypothetical protein